MDLPLRITSVEWGERDFRQVGRILVDLPDGGRIEGLWNGERALTE
jgi:hypothetical protein